MTLGVQSAYLLAPTSQQDCSNVDPLKFMPEAAVVPWGTLWLLTGARLVTLKDWSTYRAQLLTYLSTEDGGAEVGGLGWLSRCLLLWMRRRLLGLARDLGWLRMALWEGLNRPTVDEGALFSGSDPGRAMRAYWEGHVK